MSTPQNQQAFIDERDLLAPLRASQPHMTVAEMRATASRLTSNRSVFGYFALGAAVVGVIALLIASRHMNDRGVPKGLTAAQSSPMVTSQTSRSASPSSQVSLPKLSAQSQITSARSAQSMTRAVLPPVPSSAVAAHEEKDPVAVPDVNSNAAPPGAQSAASAVETQNRRDNTNAIDTQSYQLIAHSHSLPAPPRDRMYGAVQYGTIMGALNTAGGGFSLSASHNWMQASIRYTSTFGLTSTELFAQPYGKTGSQNVREYAVMLGARMEEGDFWASFEAGPNIINASFNSYYAFPVRDTLSNDIGGGLGASAQATFGYKFNDHVGVDFTGFVSNHSITYGGLLLSIVVGEL